MLENKIQKIMKKNQILFKKNLSKKIYSNNWKLIEKNKNFFYKDNKKYYPL